VNAGRDTVRSQEFRAFLDTVERTVPPDLDVHIVLDNAATHKTGLIRSWLAKRPRFHLHFMPPSASWLNLVEGWCDPPQRYGRWKTGHRRFSRWCYASVWERVFDALTASQAG